MDTGDGIGRSQDSNIIYIMAHQDDDLIDLLGGGGSASGGAEQLSNVNTADVASNAYQDGTRRANDDSERLLTGNDPTTTAAAGSFDLGATLDSVNLNEEYSRNNNEDEIAAAEAHILAGMSQEEKAALLAEQQRLMEQFAAQKSIDPNSAQARANAFESRSFSAAVSSVGGSSSVDPSTNINAMTDQERADLELAERLQQEEYEEAERNEERRTQRRQPQQQQNTPANNSDGGGGWMEWLGLSDTSGVQRGPVHSPSRPLARGEMGMSLPPGAARPSSAPPTPQRHSAEETITFSPSYEERASLMNGSGGGGSGARVAERQPLFACVADSITQGAAALNTNTLISDREGNVHGIDSSSLLNSGSGEYQQFDETDTQRQRNGGGQSGSGGSSNSNEFWRAADGRNGW